MWNINYNHGIRITFTDLYFPEQLSKYTKLQPTSSFLKITKPALLKSYQISCPYSDYRGEKFALKLLFIHNFP